MRNGNIFICNTREKVSPHISRRIAIYYRIVPTIRKHIMAEDALAGGGVGVGVYEAAGGGIVITGL